MSELSILEQTARELGACEYQRDKYRRALEAILRTGNLKEGHNTAMGHALCKNIATEALGAENANANLRTEPR